MSAPTVRWGVTIISQTTKKRVRHHVRCDATNPKYSTLDKREAFREAAQFYEAYDPRIVKLTRKPKPKVVAKDVTIQLAYSSCVCCSRPGTATANEAYEHRSKWLRARQDKRIRVTLEQLADE